MNVGLIIVINTFENDLLKAYFITSINELTDCKICFVCNSSSDHVFEVLTEIAEYAENAFVVNARKKKSNTASIRAGARYLGSQFNLKSIGFIVDDDELELLEVLKAYCKHRHAIVSLNQIELSNKSTKQTFYQRLFPVTEYLTKITSNTII